MRFGIRNLRLGLQARISLVVVAIVLVSLGIETFFIKRHIENYIIAEEGQRVLNVATATAQDPDIIAAFKLKDPSSVIQPIAEKIRMATGTTFVVVFNMETVRYSHPLPDRIGKHFVGGDELESLSGKRYISQALGTLGVSLRAFVPIYWPEEQQIGVVSVGKLLVQIEEETRRLSLILYYAAGASLLIGLGGALFLSRNIKRTLFGLEPHEIATLHEERNVIISSIKEGIIAVDLSGRIILINDNAKKILGLNEDLPRNCRISDIISNSKLPAVIASGKPDYDEEQFLGDHVVLVNRIPMISGGKIIGAVSTFRDMSEVRTLAEELTAVKQYVNGLRSQHHEFLNKLHVIAGLLQLGRYKEAVKYTVSAVSRDQRIFDTLRKSVHTPAVSGLLIAKITEGRENEIDVQIEGGAFPAVREECVNSVVTILGNIIQNSVDSLRTSEREGKRIVVEFTETEKDLILDVKDNGNGIPPELRDRIFEEGFTSKTGARNMGLGLFLVRRHLDRLGGTIEFRHGEGTESIVRIPKETILP